MGAVIEARNRWETNGDKKRKDFHRSKSDSTLSPEMLSEGQGPDPALRELWLKKPVDRSLVALPL